MIKKMLHIFMIFALIFSMFSGVLPADSASAASYVSGMTSASAKDIASMAKVGVTDWKATIGAYDSKTGALINTPTVVNKPAIGSHKVNAPTIPGYTLFGYKTQTVRVSTFTHSPKVTFKYTKITGSYVVKHTDMNGAEFSRKSHNNVALGSHTASAINVAGYELDGAATQTITLTEANKSGTIVFKYKKKTVTPTVKPTYSVIYETEDGAEFKRKNVTTGLVLDKAYTETALSFAGYELVGTSTQTLSLTNANPTQSITFIYKVTGAVSELKGSYTVSYRDKNGAEFQRDTQRNIALGEYTVKAKEIDKYKLTDAVDNVTFKLTEDNPTQTVTFTYEPITSSTVQSGYYTVIYETDKGVQLGRKTLRSLPLGIYVEEAREFKGFELTSAQEQTIELSQTKVSGTMTFTYKSILADAKTEGTYTVIYENENGAEFSRKTVKALYGTYYESAKSIPNHTLTSDFTQNVTISAKNPTATLRFAYTPSKVEVAETASYTVVYKDANGGEFNRKTVKNVDLGTYTETAKTIPYYTLVGAEEQKVTVSESNRNPSITFTYTPTTTEKEVKGAYTVVYVTEDGAEFSRKSVKDVAFGTYYESAKTITNYELVGSSSKSVTVSNTNPTGMIYFTYKPVVKDVAPKTSYTVVYKDAKGAEFSRKTVKGIDFGTYTESAKTIPYYTLVGATEQKVTVSATNLNPVITFSYKATSTEKEVKGAYTVVYMTEDGAEFSRKSVKDVSFGTYYESAKAIHSYEVVGSASKSVSVTKANPKGTIYFIYKPLKADIPLKTSYTVVYKDANGAEFSRKTVKNVDFGTYTESAKTIPNYTLVGGETKTVTVSENEPNPSISFSYKATKDTAPQVNGSYTVIYTTADGAEFSRKTVKDLAFGNYYESAKEIPNYEVEGSATKEVSVSESNPKTAIYFTYKPTTKEVATSNSYTVIYKNEKGAEFNRKVVTNVDFGTYTETAKTIPYHTVVGSEQQTVTVSKNVPTPSITFTYEATEAPTQQVKGEYTVVYTTADGAEFSRKTVNNLKFGTYTVDAKEIPNYTVVGATSKVVSVSASKPSTVIYFQYRPTAQVAEEQTYSYTVVYKDAKGAEFSRKTVKDIPYGTYYETAKEIPNFKIVGEPTKTITLSPTSKKPTVTFEYKAVVTGKEAKGTYTVVYENADGAEFSRKTVKGLAFGKYSETAKEIPNYTLVGSKTKSISVSKNAPNATVYFVYEASKKAVEEVTYSYTVIYKNEKGAEFSRKTVEGLAVGTYSETAKEIPYFTVVGDKEKKVTLGSSKPVESITFTYSAIPTVNEVKGEYTVVYENPDGAEFSRKTVKDLEFGTYTETAKSIPNYTIKGNATQKVVVSKTAPKTVVYFTYEPSKPATQEKTASYTVIYKDSKGAEFSRKTVGGLPFGKYTETAKEIPHYTVKGDSKQTVNLVDGKPTASITFTYTQKKVANAKKGTYTVVYETEDGAEFNRKAVKDIAFGNYTEVAKTIPNYSLVGERIKDVKVTSASPTATIYFTYAPKASAETAKTKGSYTVVYETENGAEFNRTTVKDKAFGTYYVTAKDMKGYELVGAKTKTVIVSANQPSAVIYFVYKPKTTDVEKLGSYTVIHTDGNGAEIGREVVKDVEFGEYTVSAKDITGYEVQGKPTQKFAVLPEEKTPTITFTYKYKGKETGNEGSYMVRYVDKATGSVLGEMKYSNLRLATYTERAAKFLGYTLASKDYQSVGLTKAKPSNTIVFDYVPNANLCVLDFTDSVEFTGSKTSSKAYSKSVHFSVDPSHFTANKQYKVTVKSEDGIYNVKIYAKSNNKWSEIGTTKGLMDVTLYSDCFDDKVFLKLSTKLETSSVPHVNNKTAISLKLSRSEQLVYKHNINPFIDITGNAVVQNFRMREIVYGTTYTSFNPNGYFSRAHMFAVISRGLGLSQNGTAKFKDLKKNVWYYDNVMRLNYVGIVLGDNGNAKPNGYTTANQLHLMLDRTSKLYGGKGVDYNTHFKGYKKNDKIKRIDAVRIVSDVFVELNIINE